MTNVAINELAAVVGVNGTLAAGISSDNPECAGKDVENDSRWRSDTLSEIKCFSGPPRKKGFSVHRLWYAPTWPSRLSQSNMHLSFLPVSSLVSVQKQKNLLTNIVLHLHQDGRSP